MAKDYLQYKIFKPFYENAARNMCEDFRKHVSLGNKVLDLGCGCGIVAKTIEDELGATVEGVDIIDMRTVDISFKKYDGKDLSFIPDNSYDVVLISYVLHHTGSPIEILKQVRRITRNKVIIYEDMNEGILGKVYCKIHGKCFENFFQKNDVSAKFFNKEEWMKIFNDLDFELLKEKNKPYFLNPVKRKLFILKKGV